MDPILRTIIMLAFLTTSSAFSAPQAQKGQPTHEKIIIPKVNAFEHEVPLPPDVLKALMNDDGIKAKLQYATSYQRNHPAELFFASEARLGQPDEVDFIVGGMPSLCGVSFDWYWVVRPTPYKPRVILFATGNVFEVMDSRTQGYREFRTVGGTDSETDVAVYHFDGKKYKLGKKKSVEDHP